MDYIGRHTSGNPFFLYLAHIAVHPPLEATEARGGGDVKGRATCPGMIVALASCVERILKSIDDKELGKIR